MTPLWLNIRNDVDMSIKLAERTLTCFLLALLVGNGWYLSASYDSLQFNHIATDVVCISGFVRNRHVECFTYQFAALVQGEKIVPCR